MLTKLEKKGKGIVLMHDFQKHTAAGTMELLNQLKAKGYKIVHMRAKSPVTTLAEYDEMAKAEFKGPVTSDKPTSSVVKTVAPSRPSRLLRNRLINQLLYISWREGGGDAAFPSAFLPTGPLASRP